MSAACTGGPKTPHQLLIQGLNSMAPILAAAVSWLSHERHPLFAPHTCCSAPDRAPACSFLSHYIINLLIDVQQLKGSQRHHTRQPTKLRPSQVLIDTQPYNIYWVVAIARLCYETNMKNVDLYPGSCTARLARCCLAMSPRR